MDKETKKHMLIYINIGFFVLNCFLLYLKILKNLPDEGFELIALNPRKR